VRGECSGSTISLGDPTWRVGMMRTVRGEEGGWLVGGGCDGAAHSTVLV